MAQIGTLPGGNLRTGRLIVERVEERDLLKFLDLLLRRHLTGYPLMAFAEINDISSRGRLALDLACTRKSFPQRRLRRDEPSITRTAADRFKMGLRPFKPGGLPARLGDRTGFCEAAIRSTTKEAPTSEYCIQPRFKAEKQPRLDGGQCRG